MKFQLIPLVYLFLFYTPLCYSQYSEIGVGYGTLFYWGDLTSVGPNIDESKFAGSAFYRYNFNNHFSVKAQYAIGDISANDRNNPNESLSRRNLHFKSRIQEVSLVAEINFRIFTKSKKIKDLSPIFFLGISGYRFNPKALHQDEWYELQPLSTGGQGLSKYPNLKPYQRTSINIPFGLGLKNRISRRTLIGLEVGFRKLFTDYLDDVSGLYADNNLIKEERGEIAAMLADRHLGTNPTPEGALRGNAENKDWYGFVQVYITYNFISKTEWHKMRNPNFYK